MGTILPTMTKKKTKKRRFDPLFHLFRHPPSPFGHLNFVRLTIALAGLLASQAWHLHSSRPAAPRTPDGSHAHDFVIFATVFTDKGFALPGARARVRREEEKKFRWEAMSDHQGELAVRVPQGAEYEMTIEARGFKTETRKIDTREDNRTDLTIQMEPGGCRSRRKTVKLPRTLAIIALAALAAAVMFAQEKPKGKESELRTVRGTVVDKDETPVDTAVVYLKNVHTQDITTHLSDSDGNFVSAAWTQRRL